MKSWLSDILPSFLVLSTLKGIFLCGQKMASRLREDCQENPQGSHVVNKNLFSIQHKPQK